MATVIGPPANLVEFDPSLSSPEEVVLHTFDSILGLSGITEIQPDVFIITGANTTGENIMDPPLNATGVWRVDFNQGNGTVPAVELIANPTAPAVTDFNGLTTYNESLILASASFEDSVFALDVNTGDYWEVIKDATMPSINGIKLNDGFLYWTSTDGFFRAELYEDLTIGAVQNLTTGSFDDFAVSPNGFAVSGNAASAGYKYAYIAGIENVIEEVVLDAASGEVISTGVVDGATNSTTVARPTGCEFGRTKDQENKLFCTTGGAMSTNFEIGGQLLELTLY